jgi:hypothetical protein
MAVGCVVWSPDRVSADELVVEELGGSTITLGPDDWAVWEFG